MKRLLVALVLFAVSARVAAAAEERTEAAIQVHGCLSLYNGTPSFRIWVVGTKHIFGVAESPPETPLMPSKLFGLARDHFVFADFTVIPLTKDDPGVMRMVRVIRAEKIIVTDGNLKVIQKIATPVARGTNQMPATTTVTRTVVAHR